MKNIWDFHRKRKTGGGIPRKKEPGVLQDRRYEIVDTGRFDYPFSVHELTRTEEGLSYSGNTKFCRNKEEVDAWIEEQQEIPRKMEAAIESSEDYEDAAVSFVTTVDPEGNQTAGIPFTEKRKERGRAVSFRRDALS